MAPLTIRQYIFLPDAQRQPFLEQVLEAIKIFLRTSPTLSPPTVKDNQPHPPGQLHGSIILPLWSQTPTFNTKSPHWTAFNTLLDTLSIAIFHAASNLKKDMPFEVPLAVAELKNRREGDPSFQAIPDRLGPFNCFESCRLSVNESLAPHALESYHKSQMAVIMWFGDFSWGGRWVDPVMRAAASIKNRSAVEIRAGRLHGTTTFAGEERYQVELFLPDLGLPTWPRLMGREDEEDGEETKKEMKDGVKKVTKEETKQKREEEMTQEMRREKSESIARRALAGDVEVMGEVIRFDWREDKSDDDGGDEEDVIQPQSVRKDYTKVPEKSEENSNGKGEETKDQVNEILAWLKLLDL